MATFGTNQCHHRAGDGTPDCRRQKGKPYWMFCASHEAEYRVTHVPQKRGARPTMKARAPVRSKTTTIRSRAKDPAAPRARKRQASSTARRRQDRTATRALVAPGPKRRGAS